MLLFITYSYIRSWKKYIIKSWKKGIKKALNMNKEDIQKEIIKNNKKTVAVIIHLSKIKFDYWKYISLLNIESSALYFLQAGRGGSGAGRREKTADHFRHPLGQHGND